MGVYTARRARSAYGPDGRVTCLNMDTYSPHNVSGQNMRRIAMHKISPYALALAFLSNGVDATSIVRKQGILKSEAAKELGFEYLALNARDQEWPVPLDPSAAECILLMRVPDRFDSVLVTIRSNDKTHAFQGKLPIETRRSTVDIEPSDDSWLRDDPWYRFVRLGFRGISFRVNPATVKKVGLEFSSYTNVLHVDDLGPFFSGVTTCDR